MKSNGQLTHLIRIFTKQVSHKYIRGVGNWSQIEKIAVEILFFIPKLLSNKLQEKQVTNIIAK